MHGPRYHLQVEKGERQGLIVDRHGNPALNNDGVELRGAVLDHKSITQRNFGSRALFAEVAAGIEQVMDPGIGALVEYVSDFWVRPNRRFAVSVPPIHKVVYGDDARGWGDEVRGYHRNLQAFDEKGRSHNALDPNSFYWAHDTFKEATARIAEHFNPRPFTLADREQLHLESNTWYSHYGMPMGIVPEDYAAYQKYRKDVVENRLEMTPSAERAIDILMDGRLPIHEFVPKQFRGLARTALTPASELVRLFGIGEISPDIRQRFDIPFSEQDQQRLDDFRGVSRLVWNAVPRPLLYYPVAYDARLRETGGRHRNTLDRLAHTALTRGAAVANTAINHARHVFTPGTTDVSTHVGDVDFYPPKIS